MRALLFLLLSTAALLGDALIPAAPANAASGANHAVFVQTNDPAGNRVLAYTRGDNGQLTLDNVYDAGGFGGRLEGAVSDPLASQGSLVYDPAHALLIGVNAGSNGVYSFQVDGDHLSNRVVADSGGTFPVSVAVHGDLVYVLNAGGQGRLRGFHIQSNGLQPIAGSSRSLDLTPPSGPTTFTHTPGQVGFTPGGSQLVVTTKANGNDIDVFGVDSSGTLSATPVVNNSTTPIPFSFTFDSSGHLLVGEAGTSNVSAYNLSPNGTLSPVATASDAQMALCWIAGVNSTTFFVSNTGSGTLSAFSVNAQGRPKVLSAVAATPRGGPIDLGAADGTFLYVELGTAGVVAEYTVSSGGGLTPIGSVPAQAGMEGLVVT